MLSDSTPALHRLTEAYHSKDFRELGHQLVDQLADHLKGLEQEAAGPVYRSAAPEAEADFWRKALEEPSLDRLPQWYEQVIDHSIHLHHPRYMGHQISPPAPVAALAGLMGDLLNNGMGVYEMGVAATSMEKVIIEKVAQQFGMSEAAGGFLTSGGTLANLTALLAARQQQAPEEVWTEGSGQQLAVLVSEEAHYCIDRAVRIMGWGSAGIIKVPTDREYRMRTDLLEEYWQKAIAQGQQPIAVVGSACSTSTGAYDDLEAIAEFCAAHQLWFHVDGAHGAAVAFSDKYQHLIKGIAAADSVAMDFHKMLMTPALATALVFREESVSYQTFSQKAQYLWEAAEDREWFNLARRTFECTKYMMSLKIFSILQAYGSSIWNDYVTRCYDLGQLFAQQIGARPSFELATPPDANIVCFRLLTGELSVSELDQLNARIRKEIVASGDFYLVQTTLKDRIFLRVTLTNPFTRAADLEALLDRVERVA